MANRRKGSTKKKEVTQPSRLSQSRRPSSSARNRRVARKPKATQPVGPARNKPQPNAAVRHEAVSVALACAGLITILSLTSYDPQDISLNTSGKDMVNNWAGPAGAYIADLLLQALGVGALVLGVGLLLASWRAMAGRRVLPGLRETFGTLLLVVCAGAFAHIFLRDGVHAYPAGGILGAIAGDWILREFALIGGYVITGGLVLVALAVAADGVLTGLGQGGLGALAKFTQHLQVSWTVWQERRRQMAIRRAERVEIDLDQSPDTWAKLPNPVTIPERLRQARERGRAMGDKAAEKSSRLAKKKALRAAKEPEVHIETPIDLVSEVAFDMGELPAFAPTPAPASTPQAIAETEPSPPPPLPLEAASEFIAAKPKSNLKNANEAQPEIVDLRPEVDVAAIEDAAQSTPTNVAERDYQLPSPMLLDIQESQRTSVDREALRYNATRLTKTLKHYGIEGQVREIRPGPVITMYEFVPAPGTKISKIANLADDLAMSMEAVRVRIVAPIPGKGAVGIEIPNESVETVYLKELVTHQSFQKNKASLPIALGKDIEGNPHVADLAKMPHLLVAGATGAGKSVSVNAMIMSILYNASPRDVRMIMVDPKMLELSVYDGIPHLLLPVVTDPKKAAVALRWAVNEMESRYKLLSATGVRSIDGYNKKVAKAEDTDQPLTAIFRDKLGNAESVTCEHMPYIVIIVDELADLMMVASREVEASIMRLAQMARAAGIHLVLATQRPSVDVLTGVIKANFPTRIAFQVASKHDSRTILDGNGAEHLLGRGDMLYLAPGSGGLSRLHGSYVSEEEIERTVAFVKENGPAEYDESILAVPEEPAEAGEEEPVDEMYDQAVAIVTETRQASISMIQRRLRIGYNRAARLVETMEREGIVGPPDGAKPREVLVQAAPI